jgi:hypothetical protein
MSLGVPSVIFSGVSDRRRTCCRRYQAGMLEIYTSMAALDWCIEQPYSEKISQPLNMIYGGCNKHGFVTIQNYLAGFQRFFI